MYQTNDRLIDYKGTQKYLITQIKKEKKRYILYFCGAPQVDDQSGRYMQALRRSHRRYTQTDGPPLKAKSTAGREEHRR